MSCSCKIGIMLILVSVKDLGNFWKTILANGFEKFIAVGLFLQMGKDQLEYFNLPLTLFFGQVKVFKSGLFLYFVGFQLKKGRYLWV